MKKLFFIALAFSLNGSPALAGEFSMEELPMYGGQHDPKVKRSRESSASAAQLGWKNFYQGDASTAMKRFNQAWMFDRKNPQAYWGFGIIVGLRADQGNREKLLSESIQLLSKAHELEPKNGKITGDLAYSHTLLGHHLETLGNDGKSHFLKAETLFAKAYKTDSSYPPLVANYGILKFYTGDYSAAERLTNEAKELGYTPSSKFQNDLKKKLKQSQN